MVGEKFVWRWWRGGSSERAVISRDRQYNIIISVIDSSWLYQTTENHFITPGGNDDDTEASNIINRLRRGGDDAGMSWYAVYSVL